MVQHLLSACKVLGSVSSPEIKKSLRKEKRVSNVCLSLLHIINVSLLRNVAFFFVMGFAM